MSAGWEVGELAVCVDVAPYTKWNNDPSLLKLGRIYKVAGIGPEKSMAGKRYLTLVLASPHNHHDKTGGFASCRFRKVEADEPTACETEFVTLLKRSKQPVPTFVGGIASEVSSVGGLK